MITVLIGLPMPIIVHLEHLQPAISEYLLQPEEPQLRQRMRSLEKLYVSYRSELTGCPTVAGQVLDLTTPKLGKSTRLKVRTRGPTRSITFQNYTHSEPRFRALLTDGGSGLGLAMV
jgi:hypothetical protein